ncbi:ABC transporter substrate-binding protein [Salinibacterium sp. SWN167]|uniref:ABC transporter substrate-binding protein n=1 Tax=Salinibacterium sp. SWN167 TaxID=2792054 RepID=UPI0018CD86E3|nr:ABC transporter substrate-binding protein [Salinibacterium sp. SWN167]MBH0082373.1 ABC transporter substrate-binding protein [Salinibacterium sp. SWN167]
MAVLLGACGAPAAPEPTVAPEAEPAPTETAEPQFPTTVVHSGGETTLESAPDRVFTFGQDQTDAFIALGVVPIATEEAFGKPWRDDALAALGVATPPEFYPRSPDEVADVAALSPDINVTSLIFSPYDYNATGWIGFYDGLTDIAPTVRPSDAAIIFSAEADSAARVDSSVAWREAVTQAGQIMGISDEAAAHLASIDDSLAAQAAAHPEFEGKTIGLMTGEAGWGYGFKADTEAGVLMEQLGFDYVDVSTMANQGDSYNSNFVTLSLEDLSLVDVDVLVVPGEYNPNYEWHRALDLSPTASDGVIIYLGGTVTLFNSMAYPSALSVPWGVDDFVAALAAEIS